MEKENFKAAQDSTLLDQGVDFLLHSQGACVRDITRMATLRPEITSEVIAEYRQDHSSFIEKYKDLQKKKRDQEEQERLKNMPWYIIVCRRIGKTFQEKMKKSDK